MNQGTKVSHSETPHVDVNGPLSESKSLEPTCPNCRRAKPDCDSYCRYCGQRHTRPDEGLGYFVRDFVASFLSLDGRAFRTVTALLFNPGKCAKDFLNGRRNHYLSTAQTYLVSGFFFFLVFGNWIDIVRIEQLLTVELGEEKVSIAELNRVRVGAKEIDSPGVIESGASKSEPLAPNQEPDLKTEGEITNEDERAKTATSSEPASSEQSSATTSGSDTAASKRDAFLNEVHQLQYNGKPFRLSIAEFRQFAMQSKEAIRQVFLDQGLELRSWEIDFVKNLALMTTDHGFKSYVSGSVALASQLALLMLPLLAVLIRVFHWRSCRTWLAAFVVSANWHSSMYLAMSVIMLLNFSLLWALLLGSVLGTMYWVVTLRQVFGQGWLVIFLKTFFVIPMYGFGLFWGFVAAVTGSIFMF